MDHGDLRILVLVGRMRDYYTFLSWFVNNDVFQSGLCNPENMNLKRGSNNVFINVPRVNK